MRILIVDDSAFMRRSLTQMLQGERDFEIVGTASNGKDAVEKVQTLKPDLVTLDVEMPVMDGLEALKAIRKTCGDRQPAVVMCSTTTSTGSANALEALRTGASDFVTKDLTSAFAGAPNFKDDLIAKLRAIGGHVVHRRSQARTSQPPVARPLPSLVGRPIELVVIGSSTGGPPIVERLLQSVPKDFPAPIVVAQHMPPIFTQSMARRLHESCAIEVHHAESGMAIRAGAAYIAPGGLNTRIRRGAAVARSLEISEQPLAAIYRPSVNELFGSAAAVSGARTLGIMLTGMGDDGLIGSRALHAAGGVILAQSEESCVVYGMPRAVTVAQLTAGSGDPGQLVEALRSVGRGHGLTAAA